MTAPFQMPRINAILAAIKELDRKKAAAIIREDLERGPPTGDVWRDVGQLAGPLGEYATLAEAAKRYAATNPHDIDYVFYYAMVLSRLGRHAEALVQMDRLPPEAQEHPAILHFRGMAATQMGDFAKAEALIQKALAVSPAPVQWLALSVAHKFTPGDPYIAQMEAVLPRVYNAPPYVKAQLMYSLGKAYDDVREMDKAAAAYASGASLMLKAGGPPDGKAWDRFVSHLIDGYTAENMARLKPSGAADTDRMIFVTGFPRSGTTLVEQILTSHSQIGSGAELNLIPVALMPMGDYDFDPVAAFDVQDLRSKPTFARSNFSFEDAIAYQERSASDDPWGDIARDYFNMVDERFEPNTRNVDKSLNLGSFMGVTLHTLPKAKIVWLRRRPEDCALSNYRLYSNLGNMPWTYSASDIAEFFKSEDRLYYHWTQMYPDRILTVPYEELVSDPQDWIRRILAFTGLPEEPQVFEPHKSKRTVVTASMAQVRSPISTARIGAAEAYSAFTEEFRKAYYG